jgi:hypothetical protein
MAVASFMADAKDRGNSEATFYKKRLVFEKVSKSSASKRAFGSYRNWI